MIYHQVKRIANNQVRNVAAVGANIITNNPTSDLIPALVAAVHCAPLPAFFGLLFRSSARSNYDQEGDRRRKSC